MAAGEFGIALRRYRVRARLTQEALAARAGLSVRGISDLERGCRTAPRDLTVARLADALALSTVDREELVRAARRPDGVVASRGWPDQRADLPTPLTSFVGREADVAAVRALVSDPGVRLITLGGPGGVGKTRLALEVARRVADEPSDGPVFVPLADVREPDLLPSAIARVLGVRDPGAHASMEALAQTLRGWELLLILDNLEQVVEAAPALATLLAGAPGLTILATSRAVLRVSGEHVYPVRPLPAPPPDPALTFAQTAASEAVRLFVERARTATADFVLTPENAADVGAICRSLDGLPLAIELAAARVGQLPPAFLLERLERRLPVLTGGMRDQPARLRSLRDAIAWSHELLSPMEQALFRRLAVFAGGFAPAAAEIARDGEVSDSDDLLEAIGSLVDQHLLHWVEQPDGRPRYRMLETIREYAQERLVASGEAAAMRARHAAHFLALAEDVRPRLHEADQRDWLDLLEREHDNLRAALRWALEAQPETALRLCAALWFFWSKRAYQREGVAWLERALARTDGQASAARAEVLLGLGYLAAQAGDLAAATEWVDAGQEASRALGADSGVALALTLLGNIAIHRGDVAGALPYLEASIPLYRVPEDEPWSAHAVTSLGFVKLVLGDAERGMALCEEGLARQRAIGEWWGLAAAHHYLGEALLMAGMPVAAGEHYGRAATLWIEQGDAWFAAYSLVGLVDVAMAAGATATAARLTGAIEARREAALANLPPVLAARCEAAAAAARAALRDAAFAAEQAIGRAWTPEQLLVEVTRVAGGLGVSGIAPPPLAAAAPRADHALTPRELEVLRLVAEGRTDKEIAAVLGIAHRTVTTVVRRVLAKLGVASRAAAAAWAARRGLA